jgi:hypothetical protein
MPRRAKKKFHFLYKTTNLINGKFYIGVHSTDNLNDGYLGSGKILRYSINKYGEENFQIERLEFFENKEKLFEREKEIVNESFLKDPSCMNLGIGGNGGIMNEEHAKKFHAAGGRKVFQILSERHSQRLKEDLVYKEKYSKIMSKSLSGEKNGFYGKTHSEESIHKMKDADRSGSKNSQYGTCWITNGQENKKIKKEDNIPAGWKYGRKDKGRVSSVGRAQES